MQAFLYVASSYGREDTLYFFRPRLEGIKNNKIRLFNVVNYWTKEFPDNSVHLLLRDGGTLKTFTV